MAAKRILNPHIQFISLCKRGMTGFTAMYKAAADGGDDRCDFEATFTTLEKFDERGLILGCMYAPHVLDGEEEWADQETCEKMAHGFMVDGQKIDIHHDGKALPRDQVVVVESFVIQKGDPRFENSKTNAGVAYDPTGGWGVVLKVNNPALRSTYRSGDWNGLSAGGKAQRQIQDLPVKKAEHMPLDANDLRQIGELVTTTVAKALKPEAAVVTPPAAPVIDIDMSDPDAVEKAANDAEYSKINKSDFVALRKHADMLRKQAAEKTAREEAAKTPVKKSVEIVKLEEDLAKAQKALQKAQGASRQPDSERRTPVAKGAEGDGNEGDAPDLSERQEAMNKAADEGAALAKRMNDRRFGTK